MQGFAWSVVVGACLVAMAMPFRTPERLAPLAQSIASAMLTQHHGATLTALGTVIQNYRTDARFTSCIGPSVVATYISNPALLDASPTEILNAMSASLGDRASIGAAAGGFLRTSIGVYPLPCAVPDGSAVVATQVQ